MTNCYLQNKNYENISCQIGFQENEFQLYNYIIDGTY